MNTVRRSIIADQKNNFYDLPSPSLLEPFNDFHVPSETTSFITAKIDWKETPNAHVYTLELPGLKKDEVKVDIEGNKVLKISGERSIKKEEMNGNRQYISGQFLRRFMLPHNVKASSSDSGVYG